MRVLFQGTFDIFHWMHLEAINLAKSQGDELVVLVNSDKLVREYKHHDPVITQDHRLHIIRSLRCVDFAVLTDDFSPLSQLKEYHVDVYCTCEEWTSTKDAEVAYMKEKGGRTFFMPYITSKENTQRIKDKYAELNERKGRVLCEECHRKI